jgi:hypothetical protein
MGGTEVPQVTAVAQDTLRTPDPFEGLQGDGIAATGYITCKGISTSEGVAGNRSSPLWSLVSHLGWLPFLRAKQTRTRVGVNPVMAIARE